MIYRLSGASLLFAALTTSAAAQQSEFDLACTGQLTDHAGQRPFTDRISVETAFGQGLLLYTFSGMSQLKLAPDPASGRWVLKR